MKTPIPVPRLLPLTMVMIGAVLLAKTTSLVRATLLHTETASLIAAAWAGGHEGAEKSEKKEEKATKPEHGKEHGKEEVAKEEPPPPPPVPEGPPPMSESEKKVLLDLRARRQELEDRDAALAARESVLGAAEQKLSARVDELKGLQGKLEALDGNRREQEEHAWQGLVKVYETMKPRDAAVIFNDLAMPVLLAVVDRMKEAKAAAILAAMSPDRARDVTTQLALNRTRAAAALETGDKPAPKGNAAPMTVPAKPPGSGT